MTQHSFSTVSAQSDAYPFTLFIPKGTKNWSVRFTIRGEKIRRIGLQTPDRQTALHKAIEVFRDSVRRQEAGMVQKPLNLNVLVDQYLSGVVGHKHKQGCRRTVLGRYLVGFIGNDTPDCLTDKKIQEYQKWRDSYWITGPGKNIARIEYKRDGIRTFRPVPNSARKIVGSSTKTKENTVLREFFSWLKLNGHLGKVPSLTKIQSDSYLRSRSSFEDDELELFRHKMNDLQNSRTHNIFKLFVEIMIEGGFRDTEALRLKWTDIKNIEDKNKIMIYVYGKSKQRITIPNPEIIKSLLKLKEITGESEYIFSYLNGNKIKSFSKIMNTILEKSNLSYDHRGVKRTCYCFRHYYITKKLNEGKNIHHIARNVGSSVNMIEKFYSHVTSEDIRRQIL